MEHFRDGDASAHPQDRPPVGDRAGRGPARLRLLLRAPQADGPAPVDVARRPGSRRGRGRLGTRPPPARDARRARADVRQVRPAAVDAARRRAAGHRRRAPRPPGRRPAVPVRADPPGDRGRARADARAGVPPLRRAADRRRLDRPGAPCDAPERRRGRGQGAAPERPAPDRVGPGAALPGRAHDQGARPRARLHRRARARRRVRPLDPAGARLQARGAPRRDLPPQLRRLGARGRAEGLLGLLERPDADARVPRRASSSPISTSRPLPWRSGARSRTWSRRPGWR